MRLAPGQILAWYSLERKYAQDLILPNRGDGLETHPEARACNEITRAQSQHRLQLVHTFDLYLMPRRVALMVRSQAAWSVQLPW